MYGDDDNIVQQVGTEGFYLLVNLLQNRTFGNRVCFNKQLISNYFGGMRKEHSSIAYKALKALVNYGILTINQDIDYTKPKTQDWIVAEVTFPTSFNEHYFTVFKSHLDIIMNYSGGVSRHKLLTLFCAIRYRIYAEHCFVSMKTLNHETGIDKDTINKYIDILSDLGLILYGNPGTRILSNGDIRESPNFYVLSVDRAEEILKLTMGEYIKEQECRGVKFITNEQTKQLMNQRRSNSCKKNRADNMLANGQLDEDEYLEIVETYEKRRDELQNLPQYVLDYIDEVQGKEVTGTQEEIQTRIDDWNALKYTDNVLEVEDSPLADEEEVGEKNYELQKWLDKVKNRDITDIEEGLNPYRGEWI